jgi:hypothetical protein
MELNMEALGLNISFSLATDEAAPEFTRPDDYVVLPQADSGLTSVYYPWVIDMQGKNDDAPERWAMYYSTDHDAAEGGIGLAFSPSPAGPFIKYQTGPIYSNTTGGIRAETPAVMWNEDEELFFMYTHGYAVPQVTALATSSNGIDWTHVGIVLSPYTETNHGSHTGYLKPFRLGKSWFGYSICKGGDYSMGALSYSKDGRTWVMDPRPFLYETQWHGLNDYKFHLANALPFIWRGEMWTFLSYGEFGSGATTPSRWTYIAPLAADGRSLRGRPLPVLTELVTGETQMDVFTCIVEDQGTLYAYTRRNGAQGDIIVLTGEA